MNDDARRKRAVVLGQLTSRALSDLLTAAGYELTGLHRKQDKVQAILHLEGFAVMPEILADLGLARLEPVTV